MSKLNAVTDVNIITKQIVINEHMKSHLLPITADEKIINTIQTKLDELERLQKKEIPIKVIKIDPAPIKYYAYYCGRCNKLLRLSDNSAKHERCHHCGQKLDWSDEE